MLSKGSLGGLFSEFADKAFVYSDVLLAAEDLATSWAATSLKVLRMALRNPP